MAQIYFKKKSAQKLSQTYSKPLWMLLFRYLNKTSIQLDMAVWNRVCIKEAVFPTKLVSK
jgi:hypothetical protein